MKCQCFKTLLNRRLIMKKEKMNFTDDVKLGTRKYSSRGISSLAKFTSANGNVYGTLALDTRRATDDDTQELPVAVRVAYDGKTVYLRKKIVSLCGVFKNSIRERQTTIVPSIPSGILSSTTRGKKKVQEQPDVIKMCADVLKDTWVLMYNLLTSTNRLLTNGLRL